MITTESPRYRCACPECPGYSYKASDMAHPPETCTEAGRLRVRAKAVLEHPDFNTGVRCYMRDGLGLTETDRIHAEEEAHSLGLIDDDAEKFTDLGREVRRLLSEEIACG